MLVRDVYLRARDCGFELKAQKWREVGEKISRVNVVRIIIPLVSIQPSSHKFTTQALLSSCKKQTASPGVLCKLATLRFANVLSCQLSLWYGRRSLLVVGYIGHREGFNGVWWL